MTNKMHFLWTCNGAAGKASEITAPEIDRTCSKCRSKMILIDGRGFINSGTHSFWAKCQSCGELEKFSDYELWKSLWTKNIRKTLENKENKSEA